MKKQININLTDETLDLISSCVSEKSKECLNEGDINQTLKNMMINYMILKKKTDMGYRVFMGKKESNLEFEYSFQN